MPRPNLAPDLLKQYKAALLRLGRSKDTFTIQIGPLTLWHLATRLQEALLLPDETFVSVRGIHDLLQAIVATLGKWEPFVEQVLRAHPCWTFPREPVKDEAMPSAPVPEAAHYWSLLWNTLSNLHLVPHPGERRQGVNGEPTDRLMVENAFQILRNSGDIPDRAVNALRILLRDAVLCDRRHRGERTEG